MNDEDVKGYIDIVIEKVGDQVQIIAEGHAMLARRFDRVDARLDGMDARFDRVEDRLTHVETGLSTLCGEVREVRDDLAAFKADVAHEFAEVKSMIRLSYAEIDGRLRTLEHEVTDLRSRIERLEARTQA